MGLEREKKAFKGRVAEVSCPIDVSELQALADGVTTLTKTFGTIPPDAIVLYSVLKRTAAFTDGDAGTFALTVGDGTTADNVMGTGDIDGGTTTVLTAEDALIEDGGTFTATLTGSVDLNTATAGSCEAIIRFIA